MSRQAVDPDTAPPRRRDEARVSIARRTNRDTTTSLTSPKTCSCNWYCASSPAWPMKRSAATSRGLRAPLRGSGPRRVRCASRPTEGWQLLNGPPRTCRSPDRPCQSREHQASWFADARFVTERQTAARSRGFGGRGSVSSCRAARRGAKSGAATNVRAPGIPDGTVCSSSVGGVRAFRYFVASKGSCE